MERLINLREIEGKTVLGTYEGEQQKTTTSHWPELIRIIFTDNTFIELRHGVVCQE